MPEESGKVTPVGGVSESSGAKRMLKLDEYVKIAAAAKFLGVSQNTLRKWADEGRIAMRLNPGNGYRLFRRTDLEKFLQAAARPAKAPKKPR